MSEMVVPRIWGRKGHTIFATIEFFTYHGELDMTDLPCAFKGASRANHMLPAMVCETPWWSP